ncbi:DUF6643 family protein [Streptomyces sp. NPDC005438]|uniref:DUF6643 family protein n=1 Tax=Streptomyces sp. NPDC005438 TaxID=3156880 RepID=UPI0033BF92A5
MTSSPRSGYYSASSAADTPIYDMLVAERGTPQIAPIRVPSPYETTGSLPALPALPAAPTVPQQHTPSYGYASTPQPAPLQQAPQHLAAQQYPRGYQEQQRMMRPAAAPRPPAPHPAAPRPAAPRPVQNAYPYQGQQGGYQEPYGRPYQNRGY